MFKVVSKDKRLLMMTFFMISMSQMMQPALSASIDVIRTSVFTNQSLQSIQTVMSLLSLVSMVGGVLSAALLGLGIGSKRFFVAAGMFLTASTGFAAIFLHSQFWELILFSVMIGLGMGIFIPTAQSVAMDDFDENERRFISGLQFSFCNAGGILMSVVAGFLTTVVWYGGYITLLLILPAAVMAALVIPKGRPAEKPTVRASKTKKEKAKLPAAVYYYGATIMCYLLLYNVSMGNLSTHIAVLHLGNSATAGFAMAVSMVGGLVSGLFFNNLSAKVGDGMIAIGFLAMFVGYTLLNVLASSLPVMFAAVFIIGMSMSFTVPQCILSVSHLVNPDSSAFASTIVSTLAPGSGGFLSPVIFTPLTQVLGGDSTLFRFQFVGIIALAAGIFYCFAAVRRNRKMRTLLHPELAAAE